MPAIFRIQITRYFVNGRRVSAQEAKRLKAEGKAVAKRTALSRKWYIRYRMPDGTTRQTPGFVDRAATMALALKLQKDAAREAAGLATPTDRHLAEPTETHLAEYLADVAARGRTADYVGKARTRIRRLLAGAGIKTLGDLDATRVQAGLAALRDGGLSLETVNHYLVAIKGFARWLWRQGRLPQDPLAGLRRLNADVERRVVRRALSADELGRLIRAARASAKVFRGLDGRDRAALYMLAAGSGLRAHELASLNTDQLVLDQKPPRVLVAAAYAKNRRQDVLPLPLSVAEYLRGWLASRPTLPADPTARLWPGTWHERAAQMLRADLDAAGIAFETPSGRADFHSLRAAYATLLARQGVNLQTAQALLRHSDPKLTARTYTKLGITDLGGAVAGLNVVPETKAEGESKAH